MKKTSNRTVRLALALAFASFPVFAIGYACAPRPAAAQSVVKERTVDGKVITKAESPISGAVVYLKDTRSLNVKTYICDDAGHFHFGQLSQNTDYDLWAESDGVRSNTKSISSFDDKRSFYFTLTVATK